MSHLRVVTSPTTADNRGLNEPLSVNVALGDPDYGNVYVTLNYDNGGSYRFVLAHQDAESVARLLQAAHAQAGERAEGERANLVEETIAEMTDGHQNDDPEGPDVRVFHRASGWTLPDYSDLADCSTNFHREKDGRPLCTGTVVWKVVREHESADGFPMLTISFYCDADLPAKHRHNV